MPDWSKPIILALLALALLLGVRFRLAMRRARRLESQRATLLQDLQTMQTALVPVLPAELGGLALSVAYQPADGPAAGGDFYDLFELPSGKVAIILGDVSGHGREALNQAALTRYTLRAYLQAGLEPRAALALAGRTLAEATIEHYATVAVALYDGSSGRLTYALAGHPPPIVQGERVHEPLTLCSSPPIGWGAPTGRRQSTISLAAGSTVCLFSDGLIEARTTDGLLGRERLQAILRDLPAGENASDLLAAVGSASESTPDDMAACILAARTGASGPNVHVEEIEVDSATLAPGSTHRRSVESFLRACQLPEREVAQTIEQAATIARAHGCALIRATLMSDQTTTAITEVHAAELSQSVLHDVRSSEHPPLLPTQ